MDMWLVSEMPCSQMFSMFSDLLNRIPFWRTVSKGQDHGKGQNFPSIKTLRMFKFCV